MNTLDAISKRKSTRAYRPEQISEEALSVIIKAGCAAPVAMAKYETLHITVIQNESILKRINEMTSEMFFQKMGIRKNTDFGAKTMILVSSAHSILSPEMEYVNVGIVVENMVIAATDMGIDSVVVGGAPAIIAENEDMIKELGIPEGFKPVLGAFFGYSTVDEPAKDHSITVNVLK